ncbi:MAG TPA: ATP-binding protein [Symbiobacteriaceae bacterium]|nr:ATP-binding protein [Symbiobacteriaceae bacterium]
MSVDFPVTYFERNMVVSRAREVWFLYRLQPQHYEHLSQDARLGLLWRFSRLFWNLEDCHGQLLIIPHTRSLAEHLAHLRREVTGPLAHVAERYALDAAREMGGDRTGIEFDYVLALRLPTRPDEFARSGTNFLKSLWKEPKRAVEEYFGLRPPHVLDFELAGYFEREEGLFQRLNRVVKATRLREADIAWVIRHGFWRGIGQEPALRPASRPDCVVMEGPDGALDFRFDKAEMARLADGELDLRNPRRVSITQETGDGARTGMTAFCYVSDLPDEMVFPGCEWLFSLQELHFPVEVSLRWGSLGHEEALGIVRRKKLEIADQDKHTRSAGEEAPIALLDAQEQVAMLEHDLKQRKFPTVLWSVCCAVSGATEREVTERVKYLRDHLGAYQISLDVPAGDQLSAFLEAIPGSARQMTDYVHRVPPEAAAASMFLATRAIGDQSGPYIGRTGMQQRPVYLDPALPPQINRSASVAFLGSLGGGKSFAANLLTYLAVVWRGAKALVLDPKGERSGWLTELPELEGQVEVITLSPRAEDSGKLDPFVMLGADFGEDERKETVNLAVSLLSFLANVPTGDDRFLALMRAVDEVSREPQPGLMKVVERLEELGGVGVQGVADGRAAEAAAAVAMPGAAALGHYLRAVSGLAYANLIFGHGTEAGLRVDRRLNVLQLQSITMPPPGKPREEFSLEELLSVALMHAITAFATRFTRQERDVFKIVLMDEAWALLSSNQGRALVSHLLRTGRAMNNAVYLISQNVADLLDERIKNNIGVKFIFRSHDQEEIARVLELLNLQPEEENILAVRGLETGQALMQDLDGRVGVVSIDAVFPHLAAAFDTRPRSTSEGRS